MQTVLPLETRRLTLRPFTAGDLDSLSSYRSRTDVARYLYWEANSEQEVRAALEQKLASTSIRSEGDVLALAIIVRLTGDLVGDVILQLVSDEHRQGEVGYIIHPTTRATATRPRRSGRCSTSHSTTSGCTGSSAGSRPAMPPRPECWRSSACAERPTWSRTNG